MKQRKIPFSPPDVSSAEIEAVSKVLQSGWITTGPRTKELERRIAAYCGTNRAACLSSATAALELTLRILGIGPGDEVITSAYTYTATASVINHVGARIVMVDTAPGSFEMNYDQLADAVTAKTKAVILADLGGRLCDYDALYAALERRKDLYRPNGALQSAFDRVIVISDAAHSFGASFHGLKSGQAGDFTAFSFHAVKNLTTAEGGAVTWRNDRGLDDDWLYEQFMLYSLHGQSKDAMAKTQAGSWEYDILFPAFKANMTDIMAAIGLAQLDRYKGLIARRHRIAARYDAAFKPLGVSMLEHKGDDFQSIAHLYMVQIPGIGVAERNAIITRMAEVGISCNVHYKPLPMFTAYRNLGFDIKDFPNAHAVYEREITLPLHTSLSDEDVDYVIEHFSACLQEAMAATGVARPGMAAAMSILAADEPVPARGKGWRPALLPN